MSITGAVSELNKEIERLTKIRDSLLQGAGAATQPAVSQPVAPQKLRYVRSAKTAAKSAVPAKRSPLQLKKSSAVEAADASKKRVVTAATRKKMSDAAKTEAA